MTRRSPLRFVPSVESFETRINPAADWLLELDGIKGESSDTVRVGQPAAGADALTGTTAQTGILTGMQLVAVQKVR